MNSTVVDAEMAVNDSRRRLQTAVKAGFTEATVAALRRVLDRDERNLEELRQRAIEEDRRRAEEKLWRARLDMYRQSEESRWGCSDSAFSGSYDSGSSGGGWDDFGFGAGRYSASYSDNGADAAPDAQDKRRNEDTPDKLRRDANATTELRGHVHMRNGVIVAQGTCIRGCMSPNSRKSLGPRY